MALLIMVVTTGFSVSQHYCMGELLYSSILGNAEACPMDMEKPPSCHKQDNNDTSTHSLSEKPCCENHKASIEGQEIPSIVKNNDHLVPSAKFLISFTCTFLPNYLPAQNNYLHFVDYRPPLLKRDIPVLIQSFLI